MALCQIKHSRKWVSQAQSKCLNAPRIGENRNPSIWALGFGTHALISCTARGAWIQSTCKSPCPWFWGYLSPKPPASFNLHTSQRNFAFFKKIVNTFSFWIMCHWLCVSSFTRECPLFSALLPFNLQLP